MGRAKGTWRQVGHRLHARATGDLPLACYMLCAICYMLYVIVVQYCAVLLYGTMFVLTNIIGHRLHARATGDLPLAWYMLCAICYM